MKIEHLAIWVDDLEMMRGFYTTYFGATSNEKYTNAKGEKIETVGGKNLDYEITKFGFNAQPLYMFISADQNALSDIKYGYDPDINKFIQHLDEVKNKFDNSSLK